MSRQTTKKTLAEYLVSQENKRQEDRWIRQRKMKDKTNECYEQYLMESNIPIDHHLRSTKLFVEPERYFIAIHNGLYYSQNNKINFIHNPSAGFKLLGLPCSETCKAELNLVRATYNYISYISQRPVTYSTLIEDYIWKYGLNLNSTTITTLYDFFFYNMGNIWYKNHKPYKCFDDHFTAILVTDTFTKELFKSYGMPVPDKSFRKLLFKKMRDEVLKPLYPASVHIEMINYVDKETMYTIKYNSNDTNYKIEKCHKSDTTQINKYVSLDLFYIPKAISDEVIQFIYGITNGNIKVLDNLAVLVADIWGITSKKQLHIIKANPENKKNIVDFLEILCLKENNIISKASSLLKRKTILQLIKNSPSNYNSIFIENPDTLIDPSLAKTFQKMLKESPISIKDDFIGKLYYENDLAIISITDDYSVISNYTNNIKSINIIDMSHIDSFKLPLNIHELLSYLCVPFLFYGFNVLRKQNNLKKVTYDHYDIPAIFINEYCAINPNAEVYDIDLYEAYVDFCYKRYQSTPLTRIIFVKKVKTVLETIKGSEIVKHCRPHHSKTESNMRAFKGLELKPEKLQAILNSEEEKSPSTEYLGFCDYLQEICTLVPDELKRMDF